MSDSELRLFLWTRGISSTAKLLLLVLDSHRNRKTGQCNPKIKTLAAEVGVSRRSLDSALAELRRIGVVEITWRQRGSEYRIAPSSEWEILIRKYCASHTNSCCANIAEPVMQILRNRPSVSINEQFELNTSSNDDVAAASGSGSMPQEPSPKSAAADKPSIKNESENGAGDLARALTVELLNAHREKGNSKRAFGLVSAIIAASADPEKTAAAIRASHAAHCEEWEAKRALNPGAFVPQLWRWFAEEEYLYPPSARKPTASQRRESAREELLDAFKR